MPADKPGRGSDQFPLRLPDGMRERIKAAADSNGRSMNAEIVAVLEEKFPDIEERNALLSRNASAALERQRREIVAASTNEERQRAQGVYDALCATFREIGLIMD